MGAADSEARRLAKVIYHPIRAKIIELLGERGPLGWKELSTELGVKTGGLYHHLDTLEGLVERDSSKKYSLTKSGRIVYSRTSQSHTIEAVRKAALEIHRESGLRKLGASLFVPRSAIRLVTSTRGAAASVFAAVALVLSASCYVAGFSPTLYYVRPDPGVLPTVGGFAASLLAAVAIGYASTRFLFRSIVDIFPLAAAASISFLPAVAGSAITTVPGVAPLFAASSLAFTLFLVFCQAWSVGILAAGMSVASGVRIERTLLVSLGLLYATMVAMLIQGTRF